MIPDQGAQSQIITLSTKEHEYSVEPGRKTEITLWLKYRGENQDYFEIGVRGIPISWVMLSEQVVQLAPGEERKVTLNVQIPAPAPADVGSYSVKVVAISQMNPKIMTQLDITLRAAAFITRGRMGVTLVSTQFSVSAGSSINIPLTLTNQGLQADSFRLGVEGLPINWISTQTPIVQLEPGEKKEIQLMIHPPLSPSSKGGRNPFRIKLISQMTPEDTVELDCVLTITPYSTFQANLQPEQGEAEQTIKLTVENQGNVDQSFNLSWKSAEDELLFEAVQPSPQASTPGQAGQTQAKAVPISTPYLLNVAAGGTGAVDFRAHPAKQATFGGEKLHQYTATVKPVDAIDANGLTLEGRVSSRAMFPSWVIPIIIVLLIGFAALFIFLSGQNQNKYADATRTAEAGIAQIVGATQTASFNQTQAANAALTATASTGETPTQELTSTPPEESPTPTQESPTPPEESPTPPEESPTPPQETPTPPKLSGMIAFASNRDGNPEIYVLNAKDQNLIRLTDNLIIDTQPALAPDSLLLAYVSNQGDNNDIFLTSVSRQAPINLTNNPADDQLPTWSPDGNWIAFTTNRDGNQEIYIMRNDGTEIRNLTNNPANDFAPSWFKTSGLLGGVEWIAFTSDRDGNQEIYLVKPDGSDLHNISNNPANDSSPSGSGVNEQIAFVSDRDGNSEIYMMNLDGSEQTNITNNAAQDYEPAIGPTGDWVAFTSERDGNQEIYVVQRNGEGVYNLTQNPAQDNYPSWR